jgi:hypothetical protein
MYSEAVGLSIRLLALKGKYMTHHTMVITEPNPNHPGFISKYYATIDVTLSGTNWEWCQVEYSGKYIGNTYSPFATEDDAKADALRQLNGIGWDE